MTAYVYMARHPGNGFVHVVRDTQKETECLVTVEISSVREIARLDKG